MSSNENSNDRPITVGVIDDDPMICQAMSLILNDYSHGRIEVVSTSTDGETCVRRAAEEKPDVVLMDIAMPGVDGIELLQRMKASAELRTIPVVMATAKGAEYDKIRGLDLGADYYLVKPFGVMELVSCVKAVLRRTSQEAEAQDEEGVIRFQGLVLDDNRKEVWVDREHVALTRIEYSLLLMMLENRGKILSRQQLINHVWPHDVIVLDRTVDVNITRLRRKVKAYAEHIVTRQGFGYGFEVKTN